MADERKKLLLNLISDVKARLDGKVENVNFPIPQFIVVGKQSVGKSRVIEALAGECFNFVSGTLGSRRPTVLEFRNVPTQTPSRWMIMDQKTGAWNVHTVEQVMQIIGQAHESLGNSVTEVPVRVKVEGADCVDLGLVDLPGFRSYAKDAAMQELSSKIESMVHKFMADENNVMLCVEEAGDAAGFSTLAKCRALDPSYRRTILIRNKLDKYYGDLTTENINKWLNGFGDLPDSLCRFAVSMPHWTTPTPPKPFGDMRTECANKDVTELMSKGASQKYKQTIGFQNFREFIEIKTQQMFADALTPLLSKLRSYKEDNEKQIEVVKIEREQIDEGNILHSTQSAGISFAQSFSFLMEGALSSETNRPTMEEELRAFDQYCNETKALDAKERQCGNLPNLEAYLNFLRDTVKLPGMDVQLNGGAQFRRLMYEIEVFTRFAGMGSDFSETDIIQARGSGLRSSSWEDIIVAIMTDTAPVKMQQKTNYVGQRLKWFFMSQKASTLDFMLTLQGSPEEHMFSRLLSKQAEVIKRNDTMRECIHRAYDEACEKNRVAFMVMWKDYMDSMFRFPLKLLKSCSMPTMSDTYDDEVAPTFETTKERVQAEMIKRSKLQGGLKQKIKNIPEDDVKASESSKMIDSIVQQTFAVIRCQIADHMQLYSESFFLLPMLRRLEGAMAKMDLADDDKARYRARTSLLEKELKNAEAVQKDLAWSVDAVQRFKVTCGGGV